MQYESVDVLFTDEGDIQIENDVILTDHHSLLVGIMQTIRNIINYEVGSWELYSDFGVLSHPLGELNTFEVAEYWKNTIITALTRNSIVLSEDLTIDVIPISHDILLTAVYLQIEPNEFNGFKDMAMLAGFHNIETGVHYYY